MKKKYSIISWEKNTIIKDNHRVIKLWSVIQEDLSIELTCKLKPKGWA